MHRYHLLHPDYVLFRIKQLQRSFRLAVLLIHVDVEDPVKPLAAITKVAVPNECTILCAWSPEVRTRPRLPC